MYRIGIDLGGTKMEGIILDDTLHEMHRKRINTEQEGGYTHILSRIAGLYDDLAKQISSAPHTLGMGTPGSISAGTGFLKNSNTVCLNNQPFRADLEKMMGRAFAIQNDANCFAMAEALTGAGKGKQMVFGVIMGTGCGGGIVYKNEVITGLQSLAGEWGHTTIDSQGPQCFCGKRGCIETYISGSGLQNRYYEMTNERKTANEIIDLYRMGEKNASAVMEIFFDKFGVAITNLIGILDPDIIVIGGGLSNVDELYTIGREHARRYIFNDTFETPIVKNQCGDSAGVWGAALIGV
jgi:fructokinase